MQSRFATRYHSPQLRPISVIIPCKGETRGTLIRAMQKLKTGLNDYLLDVVIVENGSDNLDGIPDTRYYFIEQGGLGVALKMGLMKAGEDLAFFLPADMSYDLSFVDFAIWFDMADMVIASKFLPGSRVERPFSRQLASRLYEIKNRHLEGIKVHDVTGAKMYRRSTILPLLPDINSLGIRFEIDLIKAAMKKGLSIKEVPAIVHDYGKGGLFRWIS